MDYTPNFNDPRIIKRIKTAYGFTTSCIPLEKPKSWSQSYINKHFGQQQNKLSDWLRDVLLICKDNSYNPDAHISKKYIRNGIGCNYLKQVINKETTLDFNTWCKENNYNSNDFKKDEFVKINSRYTAVDESIVNHFIEQEFGEQLRTGSFTYTDKSHRLWHPIQNIEKSKKEKQMANYGYNHNYDISTCAPSIILNLALANGVSKNRIQTIIHYLEDKTLIRETLAEHLDLPVKTIKVIINALFCGARIGVGSRFALSEYFNHNRAIARKVRNNLWISDLRKDISACWKAIEKQMTTYYKPESIDTETGEIKPRRKIQLSCRAKWDVYFTNERKILNSVIRYLDKTNNHHFNEHDGWTSKNPIDLKELTAEIISVTGLDITIDYKFISNEVETKNEADASLLLADAPSISSSDNENNKEHITNSIVPLVYYKYENEVKSDEIAITHPKRKVRSDASGLSQAEKQQLYRLRKKQQESN